MRRISDLPDLQSAGRLDRRRLLVGAAALGLDGCTLGPNYKLQTPPPADAYNAGPARSTVGVATAGGAAQRFVTGADLPGQWWRLFGSALIVERVRQAIAGSPDLDAARAALRQSQETYRAARGALFPTAGVDFNPQRARESQALASPLNDNSFLYTLHTAQVSVSYAADVFGGVRRDVEASLALAEAQRFQSQAAYLTLTSNVVLAALNEASLTAQIAATQQIITANSELLAISRNRHVLGDGARLETFGQETVLAQAIQTLPILQKQLVQQRNAAAALAGRYAGQPGPPVLSLDALTLPTDLPLSLPVDLVKHRPDIAAAAANLHAASAQVGVAIAARLPAITLSAAYGGASQQLGRLFSSPNILWNVTGDVAQPIFQGGTLLHRQRAAYAALDQAKAQYRSAVLTGCQNVADAIGALQADADGLKSALALETAAQRALTISQGLLKLGQVSRAQFLPVEISHHQARLVLVQAQAARFQDTVALFQALGGGWWNQPKAL